MHTYTKKYIDDLVGKAFFMKPYVRLELFTNEQINDITLGLKNKRKTSNEDHGTLLIEGSKPNDDNNIVNSIIDDNIGDDLNTSNDCNTSKNGNTSQNDHTKDDHSSIDNNASINDEPAKKKQKMDTNGVDVLKLVLSREGETDKFKSKFKSSLEPNEKVASTRNEEVLMEIDCEESTEPEKSPTPSDKRIWVKCLSKMMPPDKLSYYYNLFMNNSIPQPTNVVKKTAITKNSPNSTKVNGVQYPLNSENNTKGNLLEIEKIYKKYFTKSVKDTIVTIANILNIISMSNTHHKARMDESFKKRSEAEKLKERCDANRLHSRHIKILEIKLKNNFIDVVSTFSESNFEFTFQLFFLSILTVLRVLDQPRFRKGSIFKNLVLLLWNSLKNSEYNHPKIFSMLRSKTFRPDCIDIISLIEDSRDNDPGVTDRLSLFFVSTVNSLEYFQAVIDAVTSDSNEDLGLLIDNATFQCCINSKFKDPVDSPTFQHSNNKITATETTITSPTNSNKTIHRWVIAKHPDGSVKQIAIKTKPINNTAVEPPIVTNQPIVSNQPINNYYEPFSSSLQKKSSESPALKVISAKKCVVIKPNISNSMLAQGLASLSQTTITAIPPPPTSTLGTIKPPIQNNLLQRAEGTTIMLGNKLYQLSKPTGQMKAVSNGANIPVKSTPSVQMRAVANGANIPDKSPPSTIIKCYVKGCTNPAAIMCSSCTKVKYCSHNCQRRDWYENHIHDCEQLLNKRQNRP